MKITKILGISLLVCAAFGFTACTKPDAPVDPANNTENNNPEETPTPAYTITLIDESAAKDVSYTDADGVITFTKATAVEEDADGEVTDKIEVDLTGTFKGQIKNEVKGLVINLKGFTLENENAPAILCTAKTEISAKKDTENSIKVTGTVPEKTGAINGEKNIILSGGGKCSITGVLHGVKGDKVTAKGSAVYTIEGGSDSSAINCNEFQIKAADSEDPKIVTLNLINAKNGIKADKKITIQSGNLSFKNTKTALKTELLADGKITKKSSITLANCTIACEGVTTLQKTDTYTKGDGVTITGIDE